MPTLYRIENQSTMVGLWYNQDGTKTDFIKTIPNSLSGDLPMDFDPSAAGGWFSACDNLPDMKNWFSTNDVVELSKAGYNLYKVEVNEYRQEKGHAWFRREGALFTQMPIDILDIG